MASFKPIAPPLPANLPVPLDDGGAEHLSGREIPSLTLPSTDGTQVDLAALASSAFILYVFPKMGPPHEKDPPGWNETPGVYGCTQQTCGFRDLYEEFIETGYSVAGVSAQLSVEQQEAASRLQLDFPLLADPDRMLHATLGLPTFEIAGMTFYKRLTMVIRRRRIVRVFYPVFPPHKNAAKVLRWIRSNAA